MRSCSFSKFWMCIMTLEHHFKCDELTKGPCQPQQNLTLFDHKMKVKVTDIFQGGWSPPGLSHWGALPPNPPWGPTRSYKHHIRQGLERLRDLMRLFFTMHITPRWQQAGQRHYQRLTSSHDEMRPSLGPLCATWTLLAFPISLTFLSARSSIWWGNGSTWVTSCWHLSPASPALGKGKHNPHLKGKGGQKSHSACCWRQQRGACLLKDWKMGPQGPGSLLKSVWAMAKT